MFLLRYLERRSRFSNRIDMFECVIPNDRSLELPHHVFSLMHHCLFPIVRLKLNGENSSGQIIHKLTISRII
jgi:hypothetical protein